ncbi:MAG: hypothetical protein BGO67_02785 [Alphaproteobacteria bacterium 41-28]|nr:MAG: hypothetical protein BGO67_02785 [Alphaproteobacteria bacterium 41-28]
MNKVTSQGLAMASLICTVILFNPVSLLGMNDDSGYCKAITRLKKISVKDKEFIMDKIKKYNVDLHKASGKADGRNPTQGNNKSLIIQKDDEGNAIYTDLRKDD